MTDRLCPGDLVGRPALGVPAERPHHLPWPWRYYTVLADDGGRTVSVYNHADGEVHDTPAADLVWIGDPATPIPNGAPPRTLPVAFAELGAACRRLADDVCATPEGRLIWRLSLAYSRIVSKPRRWALHRRLRRIGRRWFG